MSEQSTPAAVGLIDKLGVDDSPKCGTCGAEIGTAMMAAFCPRQNACEFWPDDKDSQRFIMWARGEIDSPF